MSYNDQPALYGYTQIIERIKIAKVVLPLSITLFFVFTPYSLKLIYYIEFFIESFFLRTCAIAAVFWLFYQIPLCLVYFYQESCIEENSYITIISLNKALHILLKILGGFVFFYLGVILFLNPLYNYSEFRWLVFSSRIFILSIVALLIQNQLKTMFTKKRCASLELLKMKPISEQVDNQIGTIYIDDGVIAEKDEPLAIFLSYLRRKYLIEKTILMVVDTLELKSIVILELNQQRKNLKMLEIFITYLFFAVALILSAQLLINSYLSFGFIKPFEPAAIPLYIFYIFTISRVFHYFIRKIFIAIEKIILAKRLQENQLLKKQYMSALTKALEVFPTKNRNSRSYLFKSNNNFGIKKRLEYVKSLGDPCEQYK